MEGGAEGRTGGWGEVVTRYPYENVGMDHLLSMELLLIEKQPYETFGASLSNQEKVSWKLLTAFTWFWEIISLKNFVLWKLDNVKWVVNTILSINIKIS